MMIFWRGVIKIYLEDPTYVIRTLNIVAVAPAPCITPARDWPQAQQRMRQATREAEEEAEDEDRRVLEEEENSEEPKRGKGRGRGRGRGKAKAKPKARQAKQKSKAKEKENKTDIEKMRELSITMENEAAELQIAKKQAKEEPAHDLVDQDPKENKNTESEKESEKVKTHPKTRKNIRESFEKWSPKKTSAAGSSQDRPSTRTKRALEEAGQKKRMQEKKPVNRKIDFDEEAQEAEDREKESSKENKRKKGMPKDEDTSKEDGPQKKTPMDPSLHPQ